MAQLLVAELRTETRAPEFQASVSSATHSIAWKSKSRLVTYYSLQPHGPARLLSPWNSPGKNTGNTGNGLGSHSLLQGTFPTQGSNPSLLHCRQILYHLSHQGSPNPKSYSIQMHHLEFSPSSTVYPWPFWPFSTIFPEKFFGAWVLASFFLCKIIAIFIQ